MFVTERNEMEEQAKRSPGGKLALWALYAFCGYCVWVIVRYWWVVGKIHSVPGASVEGDFGTTAGKWLGALLGMLVLAGIGAISVRSSGIHGPPEAGGIISVKLLCSRLTFR
jgi:hypothetical protein